MQKYLKYFLIVIVLWALTLPWTANYLTSITKNYPNYFGSGGKSIPSLDVGLGDKDVRNSRSKQSDSINEIQFVRIGVVSCGSDRMNETLTMTKSAIISAIRFKLEYLELIIFADDDMLFPFDTKLAELKDEIPVKSRLKFRYEIHPLIFPPNENQQEWLQLFRPCATQRLFFPSALPHINELLYVDTDVLILSDLREIWSFFNNMNSSQHTALAPEHETHAVGWYNRFSRHPYYPPLGVNSGVMLMNLSRLREFHWEQKAIKYYNDYKKQLVYGDQDIINIIFHYYPECLYVIPCAFNYRSDHCIYGRGCPSADSIGIRLIHGNRRLFYSPSKVPSFQILYSHFEKFNLSEDDITKDLLKPLKRNLRHLNSSGLNVGCNEILSQLIFKQQ